MADWMTTKGGVSASRIDAVNGRGEADPAAPNTTEANMAKNRRVVISVQS
ncbi:MAG: hypothetical protein M3393_10325 [Actinomycetota bacterium]|nr:hypothetical protein [Actinomycetota bacterium]